MNIKKPEIRFPEFSGEWFEKKLGECVKIIMGQSPDSQFYNQNKNGLPLIQGANDFEKINNYTTQITKTCDKNDIIMSVRAPVGALTKAKEKSCIGRGVCAIKGNDFIYYLLIRSQNKLKRYSQGSTFEAINSKDLKSLKIQIPPTLAEQQKIADFLSSVDEKIEIVAKKIEELKKYKKGLLQKLLNVKKGEPELRFEGFSGKWVEKRLGEISEFIKNGFSGKQVNKITKYKVTRIETISNAKIDNNKIGYCESVPDEFLLKKGDILFSHINSLKHIGKNAYVYENKNNLYHGMNLLNIRIKTSISSLFIYYLLNTQRLKQIYKSIANKAVNQASINQTSLKKIKIHIPPTLSEQEKIAEFLSSIDEKIELNEKSLQALKKYKQGLLQKMFV